MNRATLIKILVVCSAIVICCLIIAGVIFSSSKSSFSDESRKFIGGWKGEKYGKFLVCFFYENGTCHASLSEFSPVGDISVRHGGKECQWRTDNNELILSQLNTNDLRILYEFNGPKALTLFSSYSPESAPEPVDFFGIELEGSITFSRLE